MLIGGMRAAARLERGVTLVELMVGIAVGGLIMAGAITLFAKISFSGLENVRMVRLNEQLRSVLNVMHKDLQRAGYVDAWQAGVDTSIGDLDVGQMAAFGVITIADSNGDPNDDCITYSYDFDGDNILDDEEVFGFRLNDSGVIQRDTSAADCASVGVGDGWEGFTDSEIEVSSLKFELDADSEIYEIGNDDDNGTCDSSEICLARRKINVVIDGNVAADDSFTIRLRDEIKVKNDRYYTSP